MIKRIGFLVLLLFSLQAQDVKKMTPKQAYRTIVLNSAISQVFFMPYTYLYGVTLSGDAVRESQSLARANLTWGATSVAGMAASWFAVNDIINTTVELVEISDEYSSNKKDHIYQLFSSGYPIASIIDFSAKSEAEINGNPAWSATIPEVNMAVSLPSLNYRLGYGGRYLNLEMETSLISHHTIEQDVHYDAIGIPIGSVSLPERFLMLHSMAMGFNLFLKLPKMVVQPYIGGGIKGLLNSSQSEYEGPTDTAPSTRGLALDVTSKGYGFHGILGFRADIGADKFAVFEFRPSRHFFKYKSGERDFRETDTYTLQFFEFLVGVGINIY